MAGGTGGPYDVGVARSWPIFSVAAATTFTACSGLVVRAFPLIPAPSARPLEQQGGFLPETWLRAPAIGGAAGCVPTKVGTYLSGEPPGVGSHRGAMGSDPNARRK
ncbi:hypothetical protein D7T48_20535 [Stenotrophomonas maltophilia]|nr:hypothetical protein [Stenotrophomonas maltophilia]MBA0414471.1 hypothetical protein [Stenotrophomonas maltophilia]MBA0499960.1 hypothetical protein [Stenotrophomonas maltophilia]MBA0504445.1 hypothetical protein [Stenotrophomonas maltophilia]MBA0507367.1 hypothetical protein [Stenotrophomonas maltophilia]